jgi:acyl carrier protein phosphodiesterase
MTRSRIGIVLVGKKLDDLRRYHPAQRRAISALTLLVLAMNSNQTHFEYSFWRGDKEAIALLLELQKCGRLDRNEVRHKADLAPDQISAFIKGKSAIFLTTDPEIPNYYIVVSLARFSEHWFNLRSELAPISVIGLGDWKKTMAPPSLHEIILTLVVRESIASACPELSGSVHFGTKGCICDFSEPIPDVRVKIFTGFLCDYCRRVLAFDGKSQLADDMARILDKKWIGDFDDPGSITSIMNKLGVNLFRTKALTPSWGELLVTSIRDDARRELIKMVFTVVATGLVAYLGWKAIGH